MAAFQLQCQPPRTTGYGGADNGDGREDAISGNEPGRNREEDQFCSGE